MGKELKLHRNTIGRYHERIRGYLLENHDQPTFNGEIEIDEAYIIDREKGIKKPGEKSSTSKKSFKKRGRGYLCN